MFTLLMSLCKRTKKMRNDARIVAFKTIFGSLFESQGANSILTEVLEETKLNEKDLTFAKEIIEKFTANKAEIKTMLETAVEKYELDRVYNVDLALLYLAITEFKFLETPKPVIINEVLEIAKKYSTEKSTAFINGIMAKIS